MALGVVGGDRVGDLLEDRGLARLGRRHDEASLTLADRGDEVHDPRKNEIRGAIDLETEPAVGEQRRQARELHPVGSLIRLHAVDGDRTHQRRELLLRPGGPDRAGDDVALPQTGAADDVRRDVDVLLAGEVSAAPHESVTLREDVQDPLAHLELGLVDRLTIPPVAIAVAATAAVATALAAVALAASIAAVAAVAVATVVRAGLIDGHGFFGDLDVLGDHRVVELVGAHDGGDEFRLLQTLGVDIDLRGHVAQVIETELLEFGPCRHVVGAPFGIAPAGVLCKVSTV